MTISELSPTRSHAYDPAGLDTISTQLLFKEARQRRRRRWLISSIVTVIGLLVLGALAGIAFGRATVGPVASPATPRPPGSAATLTASEFSVRPVLCLAPPASTDAPLNLSAPLPACTAASALTAGNVGARFGPSSLGRSSENIASFPPDPQFASIPSTPSTRDRSTTTVILPGPAGANTSVRYVLGPAGVTATDVRAATAQLVLGTWQVDLSLTTSGSARWDTLAHQQFHAYLGIVVDNRVISAPIDEPTNSTFTSLSGRLEIVAGLTERQAKALAATL